MNFGFGDSSSHVLSDEPIIVPIGDAVFSRQESKIFNAFGIGSCLAICIVKGSTNERAIVYSMLPDSSVSEEKAKKTPYLFVDTGIENAIYELGGNATENEELRVMLVGGAESLTKSDAFKIGTKNIKKAESLLEEYGITPEVCEIGGNENRSLRWECQSGRAVISKSDETKEVIL